MNDSHQPHPWNPNVSLCADAVKGDGKGVISKKVPTTCRGCLARLQAVER
jgi:hypothetical protein